MSGGAFDDLTDVFESIIDWPKRLAHEEMFYRRLFERVGVKSVVDTACGTGRHAAMFHSWGLNVEGADISPNMIARARADFGEPPGVRWVVRGYDQPIRADIPFDAAVCVGNSLALAPDRATVDEAIRQMLAGLRRGGVIVVHVLNVWALPDGPCVWQKRACATLPDGPALIIKGVHRCGGRLAVQWMVRKPMNSELGSGTWSLKGLPCFERGLKMSEVAHYCIFAVFHSGAADHAAMAFCRLSPTR